MDESGFRSMEDKPITSDTKDCEFGKVNQKGVVESQPDINQSEVLSPELEAVTTEADLSDWADDNETFGINAEDFEAEFHEPLTRESSAKSGKFSGKPVARIASLESLGDSDSAISVSLTKTPLAEVKPIAAVDQPTAALAQPTAAITQPTSVMAQPTEAVTQLTTVMTQPTAPESNLSATEADLVATKGTPSALAEIDTMEFMDISGSSDSESSPEELVSESFKYNKLPEYTPTTPSPTHQQVYSPARGIESNKIEQKESFNVKIPVKSKSLDADEALSEVIPCRSFSEPPFSNETESSFESASNPVESLLESTYKPLESPLESTYKPLDSPLESTNKSLESPFEATSKPVESPNESTTKSVESPSYSGSQKRYEGYIPRFKDRKMPFSLARDSIDVRKSATSKPLFTPSKEDIMQREQLELDRRLSQDSTSQTSSVSSPRGSFSQGGKKPAQKAGQKAKDGDVVRDMVMSRITKRGSVDKGRRGSRNALQLSLHSSSSSLFSSEPSLDLSLSKKEFPENSGKFSWEETSETDRAEDVRNVLGVRGSFEGPDPCIEEGNLRNSKMSSSFNKIPVGSPGERSASEYSPRSVLPATPLTHPEKFQREDVVKRELFKSSPQLHLQSQPLCSTPVESYDNQQPQSTSEFPVLRNQGANNLSKSLIISSGDYQSQRERRFSESERRAKESASDFGVKEKVMTKDEAERGLRKDPDERLKELKEERRRREKEEQREVRLRKKDSCIQECLEEYRQKRSSAPVVVPLATQNPTLQGTQREGGQTRAQLGLANRHCYRPSLLELESMQIFSSPHRTALKKPSIPEPIGLQAQNSANSYSLNVTSTASVRPTSIPTGASLSTTPSVRSTPSTPTGTPLHSLPTPVSPPTSSSSSTPSPAKAKTEPPEKRPVKKSKDRERRRSLIQVVAGMFSKSDEKKKEKEETCDAEAKTCSTLDKSSASSPSSTSLGVPPKSPSVKERFSKLRLSRSKEKHKKSPSDKNRSASVDPQCSVPSGGEPPANSLSLPTSPSRTIFSFLSGSPARPRHDKSKTSTPEENNSEDESTQGGRASVGRDSPSTNSTPSLRRQRAAMRAAKQAEQKRLRMAQEIQRQLEECEVKTRELEERGINVERALIGETDSPVDEAALKKEWFCLVQEKNALVRWQEELTVKARELELEDRHLRLENELRQRMTSAEREKTREDIEREGKILAEIISIIEQKDALVNLLEEDRQRYIEEDRDLEMVHARKILQRPPFARETGV